MAKLKHCINGAAVLNRKEKINCALRFVRSAAFCSAMVMNQCEVVPAGSAAPDPVNPIFSEKKCLTIKIIYERL